MTAEECRERLETFRPGTDVLAMVSGHGIDVVDEDPKSGGSLDNMPPFEYFGEVKTPSGGRHRYVASTFYGKVHGFSTSAGFVGDYAGGTASAGGRLLIYLPGSTRPKYPGKSYTWTKPLDIEACLDSLPDPDLVNTLEAAGASQTAMAGTRAVAIHEAWTWLEELPDRADECEYGRSAVSALLLEATRTDPGDPLRGRHGWLSRAVTRLVELSSTGCVDRKDFEAIGHAFREIKPEAESDEEIRAVQWAISNAKGKSDCLFHTTGGVTLESLERVGGDEDDAFWESRPFFAHIRAFAKSRLVGPHALLLASLVRISGAIDYRWVLPPTIGVQAPLNLFACLVGNSSTGKGIATRAARVAFEIEGGDDPAWENVGSGEGLRSLFLQSNGDGEEEFVRRSVILDVAEAARLKSLVSRRGQTLPETLTSLWSGEAIGSNAYIKAESKGILPELQYRLSMIMGAQFGMAEAVLLMDDLGLPQRMLWGTVFDSDPQDVEYDGTYTVRLPPLPDIARPEGRHDVGLAPSARKKVREIRKRVLRGEIEPDGLEGHDLQSRLRLASVIGFTDGRSDMNEEDWELSGYLFRLSVRARNAIRASQGEQRVKVAVASRVQAFKVESKSNDYILHQLFEKWEAMEERHANEGKHGEKGCNSDCYGNAFKKGIFKQHLKYKPSMAAYKESHRGV